MRKLILPAAVIAATLLTCTVGTAQTPELLRINTDSTAVAVRDPLDPLAPQQITQSTNPNAITDGTSIACVSAVTRDTGWWRLFDLDADHGLVGNFCVESVDYAIQSAIGPTQDITATIYCLDDSLPFLIQFLTPVGTNSVPQPDAYLEFFNIEVGGCCDAGSQKMAVELLSDDCEETGTCTQLFIGMNDLGQFAPTYITAPDCGVVDPYTDSFMVWHLVMVVNGQDDSPGDGGGDDGAATTGAVQEGKLVPADGAPNEHLGVSVALDGGTVVIGAYGNYDSSGSAYVFTRSNGIWTQQAKLLADDGTHHDMFGWSVALDGDTVVVGAVYGDDNGSPSGSAYVFTRSNGIWTQQAKLLADDASQHPGFGFGVALDGDTLVIGAPYDDANGNLSGSAYVFTRSGGAWSQQAKLLPVNAGPGVNVGDSVAVDGDTAVLGTREPVAYVFTRSAGVWTEQAELGAPAVAHSVALDGDTVVLGAPRADVNGDVAGAAYVYTRSSGVWSYEATLLPADGADDDEFGSAVAVDGNTVLVGAIFDDDKGDDSGSAYAFARFGGDWIQQAKLLAADGAAHDYFGWGIAVDGDTVVVGALADDDNGSSSGSAYVFRLLPDDDVPATGVVGLALLMLAMLGVGVYFLRWRATS